jgi:hypothetical protein
MDGDFNQLLKEIRQTNLCTWYLLPLAGLTRFSFGEGLFINSYLEAKKLWVIVQVPDLHLVPHLLRIQSVRQWQNDRGGFLAYQLMPIWADDVQLFIAGAYSRLSNDLKSVIFERSGLPYRQRTPDGGTETDIRLLALEGKEVVHRYLEQELDVVMEADQEVLGIPPPESFMDVQEG